MIRLNLLQLVTHSITRLHFICNVFFILTLRFFKHVKQYACKDPVFGQDNMQPLAGIEPTSPLHYTKNPCSIIVVFLYPSLASRNQSVVSMAPTNRTTTAQPALPAKKATIVITLMHLCSTLLVLNVPRVIIVPVELSLPLSSRVCQEPGVMPRS